MLVALFGFQSFSQVQPEKVPTEEKAPEEKAKRVALPNIDQLMNSKLEALKNGLTEQEILISKAQKEIEKENAIEKRAFDSNAYFSLAMKNTAPSSQYKLESTEVYLDGKRKPIAQGGKHNQGMPRKYELYMGPISPGCHELKVKAHYVRLKSDLIRQFGVDRIEKIEEVQTFIATEGYRVEIEVEGYEKHNTFANFYRGPAIRFNKSARPNFLPGAPILTMDDVLKQGRVQINYVTEDESSHTLKSKSLSIDGLPILRDQSQAKDDGRIIFDAPLAPGKHRLSASLVFGQKKWVKGGPSYNFKLNFEQDFYVISGQSTMIDLAGMPKGGIRSSLSDTRYARSTTRILSKEYSEFFPEQRCVEIKKAQALEKASKPEAKVEPKVESTPSEPKTESEVIEQEIESTPTKPETETKTTEPKVEESEPIKAEPAREEKPRAEEKAGE